MGVTVLVEVLVGVLVGVRVLVGVGLGTSSVLVAVGATTVLVGVGGIVVDVDVRVGTDCVFVGVAGAGVLVEVGGSVEVGITMDVAVAVGGGTGVAEHVPGPDATVPGIVAAPVKLFGTPWMIPKRKSCR